MGNWRGLRFQIHVPTCAELSTKDKTQGKGNVTNARKR
jgi:hypothetical protein